MSRLRGGLPSREHGIVAQNSSGQIVAWTPLAETILGMTGDQLAGRSSLDPVWSTVSVDGEPLTGEHHPAMQVTRTGEPVRGAVMGVRRYRTADFDHLWMTVDSFPWTLPDGDSGSITCFEPIDDDRADHPRIRHSERVFRRIVERSRELVGLHALDGVWLWASPAADEVIGRSPDDLIGTNVFDLIVDDDLEVAHRALGALLEDGEPQTVTLALRHSDGSPRWVEVVGQLIRDPSGRPYQVQSSFRDVTSRVSAEAQRDAAVDMLTSLMHASPIGMALLDADGTVQRTNSALDAMLGHPVSPGTSILDLVAPDDRDRTVSARAAIVRNDAVEARYEARWLVEGHDALWIESTVVAVPHPLGGVSAVLEQITDIGARKTAEADLRRRATSDALTGLMNRDAFLDSLRDRLRGGLGTGVLFIDLDDFKTANDTWGHGFGDAVLRSVAARLLEVAARYDGWVARYGGDEFAMGVVCSHSAVEGIQRAVASSLATPVSAEGVTHLVTASVGAAWGRGDEARSLIRDADRSMYLSKRSRPRPQ